eukprot:720610_1
MSYCDFCDLNFDCSMDEHSLSDGHLRKMSGGNVTTLPDIKQVDNPPVPPRAADISGSENVKLSESTHDNESVLGSQSSSQTTPTRGDIATDADLFAYLASTVASGGSISATKLKKEMHVGSKRAQRVFKQFMERTGRSASDYSPSMGKISDSELFKFIADQKANGVCITPNSLKTKMSIGYKRATRIVSEFKDGKYGKAPPGPVFEISSDSVVCEPESQLGSMFQSGSVSSHPDLVSVTQPHLTSASQQDMTSVPQQNLTSASQQDMTSASQQNLTYVSQLKPNVKPDAPKTRRVKPKSEKPLTASQIEALRHKKRISLKDIRRLRKSAQHQHALSAAPTSHTNSPAHLTPRRESRRERGRDVQVISQTSGRRESPQTSGRRESSQTSGRRESFQRREREVLPVDRSRLPDKREYRREHHIQRESSRHDRREPSDRCELSDRRELSGRREISDRRDPEFDRIHRNDQIRRDIQMKQRAILEQRCIDTFGKCDDCNLVYENVSFKDRHLESSAHKTRAEQERSRREREASEKQRRQREQMSREILGHRADKSRSRAADHKSKTPRDLSDRKQQQKYHYKAPNVESSQPSHNKWPGRSYPPVNQCDA